MFASFGLGGPEAGPGIAEQALLGTEPPPSAILIGGVVFAFSAVYFRWIVFATNALVRRDNDLGVDAGGWFVSP